MSELGTTYSFIGGNNANRIGGSCSLLEHRHSDRNRPTRIMFDLGALFAPDECLNIDAVIPDVRKYLDSETTHADERLDALFISHGHEDHIGGLVHLARAGYTFPPIYASKGTLELLKEALIEAGVDLNKDVWNKKLVEVKADEPVSFEGVEVEPFNVSHSTVGALGFHSLTTINGEVEAGILHPGDFRLGGTKVGDGFDEGKFNDLLKRKPVTHVILDSTSSGSGDEFSVTHEEAVNNTVEALRQHPEKQVVSAVISRSIQNLAIDLDAARKTGRKIFLDGYWLKKSYKAMVEAGITEFDDVVFKRSASEYKATVKEEYRYIITSGAFAESKKGAKSGLYKMSEQEKIKPTKNKKGKNTNYNSSVGHPDFKVGNNTVILARQRCIEELNGKKVRAMYARLAALGCTVIANDAEIPLGNYKTAKMQRSGHALKNEIKKFIKMIIDTQKRPDDVTFMPTHGNYKQLLNTVKAVESVGGRFFLSINLDVLKLNKTETSKTDKLTSDLWIGVCEEKDIASSNSTYKYMLVDENFVVKEELFDVKTEAKTRKNSWNALNKQSNNNLFRGNSSYTR